MDPLHKFAEFDPRKRAFSLVDEFKNFAFKGNVIDLAVGVIIGAAFGKIVSSLVEDILMPFIGILLPGSGYKAWVWEIHGNEVPYGKFLAAVVNFLLVSLILFDFIVTVLRWVMVVRE